MFPEVKKDWPEKYSVIQHGNAKMPCFKARAISEQQ